MSAPVSSVVPVFAEPRKAVPALWIVAFATAWLGIWMAQLGPVQLLLPLQVDEVRGTGDDWQQSVIAFGVISGIAGVCALIAYPLTGALSDRTTSRFGRRRPWILGGAVVFAVSLVVLGLQTSYVGLGIWWSLALTGFCVMTAALTATISDQVPVNQRGFVSGWISAPQAIGLILGLVLLVFVITDRVFGYVTLAVLLLVLVAPFLIFVKDAVLSKEQRPKLSFGAVLAGMWVSPTKHPDFAWTLTSRVLINLGNALGTTLLLYFLIFQLDMKKVEAQDNLVLLTLVYMVFVILASLVLGKLSDRLGRRKVFVFVAAALQGAAALLLAFVPDLTVAFIAAGMLGLGYGCFLSVDQALATQVLPDPHTRGKDLGIMNIATAVPQAMAPLLGAFIVALLAGFQGLFILSAAAAILGAVAVLPIRSVK